MEANLIKQSKKAQPVKHEMSSHAEEDVFKEIGIDRVPFSSVLSFEPLIREVEEKAKSGNSTEAAIAGMVLQKLAESPALLKPIKDRSVLEKNKEIIDFLMMMVIPGSMRKKQLVKASAPFDMNPIYCTQSLEQLMKARKVKYVVNNNNNILYCGMVVNACSLILNKFYGQNINVDPPIALSIQPEGYSLERHFKTQLDTQYVDIKQLKPLQPLCQEKINSLLSNIYDLDLWLQHIPPENFEFQGFVIGTLIDITEEEALSRLKYNLLERDAVVDTIKVERLQHLIRTYFDLPDLRLGVTAIDYPVENSVAHRYKIRFDFLASHHECLLAPENKNSLYDKACRYREVLLIEDLEEASNKTPIEKDLLKEGIKSIIVAPLFNKNEQVIGLLEIGAPRPYELNSFIELKFKEITGLFSMAVERSREEIDNRVEAIIREQYTAVHPSVEWKFVETSYNLLEKREHDPKNATVDPIVFHDVYPLYGQADIVSSSEKRNYAIQSDLVDNLKRASNILERGIALGRFPLLNQYLIKAQRDLEGLQNEFNSNDESRIVEWLQSEIHPLFYQLRAKYAELAGPISTYFEYLDPELGIVYRERKAYEDSVTKINNTISNYLEQQEKEAQKILPHYFEKYKTDGVEYEMYVGQSLLKRDRFSMIHLKNLRLAQLIDMCEVTRIVNNMQSQLQVPLKTAQLIFVYSTPLSIRFRMDEKQFDVDGAYNVRYEILKKRIDKSLIEGTEERLTQAGKVAIVYLQEKERQEYLEYIDYLIHEGYITEEVEDLRIGRLQGVQGLQALRITVK